MRRLHDCVFVTGGGIGEDSAAGADAVSLLAIAASGDASLAIDPLSVFWLALEPASAASSGLGLPFVDWSAVEALPDPPFLIGTHCSKRENYCISLFSYCGTTLLTVNLPFRVVDRQPVKYK